MALYIYTQQPPYNDAGAHGFSPLSVHKSTFNKGSTIHNPQTNDFTHDKKKIHVIRILSLLC